MRALLDVNFLVAVFDPAHLHHEQAHQWWLANRSLGWATCPITENGFARVVSNPAYKGSKVACREALNLLRELQRTSDWEFWEDSVSLCEPRRINPAFLAGHQQLTDFYLLALAVEREGRLATFDRRIPLGAVRGAREESLVVVSGAPLRA